MSAAHNPAALDDFPLLGTHGRQLRPRPVYHRSVNISEKWSVLTGMVRCEGGNCLHHRPLHGVYR